MSFKDTFSNKASMGVLLAGLAAGGVGAAQAAPNMEFELGFGGQIDTTSYSSDAKNDKADDDGRGTTGFIGSAQVNNALGTGMDYAKLAYVGANGDITGEVGLNVLQQSSLRRGNGTVELNAFVRDGNHLEPQVGFSGKILVPGDGIINGAEASVSWKVGDVFGDNPRVTNYDAAITSCIDSQCKFQVKGKFSAKVISDMDTAKSVGISGVVRF